MPTSKNYKYARIGDTVFTSTSKLAAEGFSQGWNERGRSVTKVVKRKNTYHVVLAKVLVKGLVYNKEKGKKIGLFGA